MTVWTKNSYGVILQLFRSLDQNGRNPRIYSKTCFNDKPKLTLTYFNIIKDMRESRNFRQGGSRSVCQKSSDVFVFLVLSLPVFYRSQMVNFKEIYHFSRFQWGPNIFQGGGSNFYQGGGVQLLIPHINPYNLWFSRGGGPDPLFPPPPPLWVRTWRRSGKRFRTFRSSSYKYLILVVKKHSDWSDFKYFAQILPH